ARPILERAVVQQDFVTKRARGKEHRRRLLADVAVADDGVVRLDAGLREKRRQLGVGFQQQAVIGDRGKRNAECAADVSRAVRESVSAAGLDAVIKRGVAAIDDGYSRRAEARFDGGGI